MRITYVCNEYPPTTHGGIGVIVKDLAEGLVEKGHEVAVIGYDPLVKIEQQQYENGVWVIRIPLKKFNAVRIGRFTFSLEPILSRRNLSNQLEKLIKTYKPDLVESFDWSGPLFYKPSVKLLVRLHGANTAHQIYEKKRPSKLLAYFEKKNIKFSDALCAVSQHIGDLTLRALHQKQLQYTCLYNFVDTSKFKRIDNIESDPFKLLYFGRIHHRKGLSELFFILNELFHLNSNVYLELAGSYTDEYKEELVNVLHPDQQQRVSFLGKIPHSELPALINSARLFVMPSRAEAFGLTAIEAMACGIPVLLTNKASGPEIVEEGNTGWLMNIDDYEESAIKINQLLSQQGTLDKVALNGRNHVLNRFSKETVLEKNIALYQSLIG